MKVILSITFVCLLLISILVLNVNSVSIDNHDQDSSSSSEELLEFIYVELYGTSGCNAKTGEEVIDGTDDYCTFINNYPTFVNTTRRGEYEFSIYNANDYLCSGNIIQQHNVSVNECFQSCLPKQPCVHINMYTKYQPTNINTININ